MAHSGLQQFGGHQRPDRQMHHSSQPGTGGDWSSARPVHIHSLPHRARSSGRHIQSAPEPPSALRHAPSPWDPSSPGHTATMPVLTRAPTASFQRHGDHYARQSYRGEASPLGARRSLRREVSPPSARHCRTTPDTTQSSRTSVFESDGVSEITVETQDERRMENRKYVRDMLDEESDEELPIPPRGRRADHSSPIRYRSRHSSPPPLERHIQEAPVRYVLPHRSRSVVGEPSKTRTLERLTSSCSVSSRASLTI